MPPSCISDSAYWSLSSALPGDACSAFAYAGLDPVQALQTMVLSSIAIQLYCVWKIRESIRWFSLWPMLAAGAATVPFGVQLLLHVDATLYAIGLGVFLTAYGCYAVFRRDACVMRATPWNSALRLSSCKRSITG